MQEAVKKETSDILGTNEQKYTGSCFVWLDHC